VRAIPQQVGSPEALLVDLVRQIEPTPTQKSGAKRSHTYLRDLLASGKMEERIVDDYLSGSYARDTAIRPLEDVDIIFVVDPSYWKIPFLSSLPAPADVLGTFERAIRYRYDGSSLRTQRRSIRLHLNHLDIDVVPAVVADASTGMLKIPDGDAGEWITTGPQIHSAMATEVNSLRGGKFKPLVKLLKQWNSTLPSTARLKSFAIETMAVRIFKKVAFRQLDEGLGHFIGFVFRFSSHLYSGDTYGMTNGLFGGLEVPDVARTGSNITANVDANRKKAFFDHATRANTWLTSARNESARMDALEKIFRLG
jgi:Second Messenger Oligonucleotide or Dinucleotide Synthetase domain